MQIISAPEPVVIIIEKQNPIFYDPMLLAFMKIESNFRTDVVNYLGCVGILQISPVMIKEVNRIQKINVYNLLDRLDSTKSVQVWYCIMQYYNASYTLKNASRIWNPTATKEYYNKIKAELEK